MMDGKISNFGQVASLRRYTLTEGREKGLDVLDCDNGKLRFLINVSKACDVMQLYHEGQNVSFVSKNGFTKRETNFLNRFEGGMLYTCGLDSVGGREGYELHGTLHNTPAEIVHAVCNEDGITVEALIRDTALFGKNSLNSVHSCAAKVLLCARTRVGRLSSAMTFAIVNVLPEPVTPSSVCSRLPLRILSTSCAIACG